MYGESGVGGSWGGGWLYGWPIMHSMSGLSLDIFGYHMCMGVTMGESHAMTSLGITCAWE